MSKTRYNAFVKELHYGKEDFDDADWGDAAYEAASVIIDDEPWITAFLKTLGVSDFKGRLADDMYSGAQIS